jgi:hypothetical protein
VPSNLFYREVKGLLHSEIPSNLKNTPSVNIYKNVFYIPWFAELISNIYKLATHSHLEPGLLTPLLWLSSFTIFTPSLRRFASRQLAALHRRNLCRSRIFTELIAISRRDRAFLSLRRSSKLLSLRFPESATTPENSQTWNKRQTCEFMVIRRLFRPLLED